MSEIPAEAVAAAAKKLDDWMSCDCLDGEYEAVMQHALEAAAPLIREAAVEEERQYADDMKLGGMDIEVAAYWTATALGLPRRPSTMRALKDLYRAGVGAGFEISKLTGDPEPEAVAAIRAAERKSIRHLALAEAGKYRADTEFTSSPIAAGTLEDFADLLGDPGD